MTKDSPIPILDLAHIDAAIFHFDGERINHAKFNAQPLREYEAAAFSSTISLLKELKACGKKTAIVSTGKARSEFLEATGVAGIPDVIVDGCDESHLKLSDKPEPDLLLKSAELLRVSPGKIAIFGNSQADVRAGRAGDFGVIIGVGQTTPPEILRAQGADLTVANLCELTIKTRNGLLKRNVLALPSGLDYRQNIFRLITDKTVVVFLDYDGTLTPIVEHPELATLPEPTRETLKQLATRCTVGIISGRDRANVHQLVNVDSLVYAGSHGFDISGPQHWNVQYEIGSPFLPVLDQAETLLREQLRSVKGILIERKKFSIAVHYRLVEPQDLDSIRAAVDAVVFQHPNIRKTEGKKVYDLQPRIDWNKGKALLWLLQALNISCDQVAAFYLGDDLTDEDAFEVLQKEGIGIVVEDHPRFTHATYRLNNPHEVNQFLTHLNDHIQETLS